MQLSEGAINKIKTGSPVNSPVMQVLTIKAMNSATNVPGGQVRYRFTLSDGIETMAGMPATQLNPLILESQVTEGSIVKLTQFQVNTLPAAASDVLKTPQQIVIILKMEIVAFFNPITSPVAAPNQFQTYAPAIAAKPQMSAQANPYGSASNPYGAVTSQNQPHLPNPVNPPTAYSAPTYGGAAIPPTIPQSSNPYGSHNAAPANYNPYGSNRPVVKEDLNVTVVPISAINPYSSKWTIKARITNKSDIRRWSNAKGEGTLFSIDLLDSQGGEIRGTFFKDACEKFFPILEEAKVYTFSGGTLKIVANKQYTTIKNQYEITFNINSEIRAVADDTTIQEQHFNFIKIDSIIHQEPNSIVDIVGIVKSAAEPSEITSKSMGGKTLNKRDLVVMDDSCHEIRLTLWGEKALSTQFNWSSQPIVAIKGCKVGDYQGRTLSTMTNSSLLLNPKIAPAINLHQWRSQFTNGQLPIAASLSAGGAAGAGNPGSAEPLEKRKNIIAIKDESMGMNEKADIVTVKGSVIYIKHDNDPWYTACPTPQCNKKVIEGMNGQYSCEKCNKVFDECHRRYILNINMADHTGSNWFSLFNDTAEKLLGVPAETLFQFKSSGNEAEYENVFSKALFKTFIGKVRVKQESVNDEKRVKSSFLSLTELDFVNESKQLIDAIQKYNI